ncbi:hypothetical protein SLS56_012123 [Neofusicoccum ribis]|uniref:Uncharacterized protein n=1 Tax=Neofusicoccum ribis TaxID=45134 RepID=A0ABR3SAE7_9PEZI
MAFLYQVAKEREWLEFEITSKNLPVENVDLDTLAYCSVRRFWEESFIWNDAWDRFPGDFWMHETDQSSEPLPTPPPDDSAPPPYDYATRTPGRVRASET